MSALLPSSLLPLLSSLLFPPSPYPLLLRFFVLSSFLPSSGFFPSRLLLCLLLTSSSFLSHSHPLSSSSFSRSIIPSLFPHSIPFLRPLSDSLNSPPFPSSFSLSFLPTSLPLSSPPSQFPSLLFLSFLAPPFPSLPPPPSLPLHAIHSTQTSPLPPSPPNGNNTG